MEVTRFFEDLVRVETRLFNAVSTRLKSEHGLSLGQYELLSIIGRRPGCRVQDLVDEVAVTVGAASKAVDRLEAAGWCTRGTHPSDRRSSVLTLTPDGARMLALAGPTVVHALAGLVAGTPAEDLARTATTLASLRAALERHPDPDR